MLSDPKSNYSQMLMVSVASGHLGVGIAVVSMSSFLNTELSFLGWKASTISIYLGVPILFELIRIYFGRKFDRTGAITSPLIISSLVGIISILLIPFFTRPIRLIPFFAEPEGNLMIIPILGLFYGSSAVLTTLIDSFMTSISDMKDRTKVAGTLHTFRLGGFAIGGIGGGQLYSRLAFNTFLIIVAFVFSISIIISVISVSRNRYLLEPPKVSNPDDGFTVFSFFNLRMARLMTYFLILYSLGLFMQDLILEVFAKENFDFERDQVGIVVAVWGSLSLVFIPVGVWLEKKVSRKRLVIISTIIASSGLLIIGLSYLEPFHSISVFYLGLVAFGIGNGLISAPTIAVMLDIAGIHKSHTGVLLSYFGVIITIGRFTAALATGILLIIFDNNYFLIFVIESIILALALIPLLCILRENPEFNASNNTIILEPLQ